MAFISTGEGNLNQVLTTEDWLIDQHLTSRMFVSGPGSYNAIGSAVSSMTQAASGIGWSRLARRQGRNGGYFAISSTDQLYAWGSNGFGNYLGTGNNTTYTTPTAIGSGTWAKVTSGDNGSVAIRKDGTLWSWGSVSNASASTPTQIGTKTDWVDIATTLGCYIMVNSQGDLYEIGNASWYSGYGSYNVALTKRTTGIKFTRVQGWEYSLVALTDEGKLYGFQNLQNGNWATGENIPLAAGEEYARPLPAGEPMWKNSIYDSNNLYYEFPRSTLNMRFKDFDTSGYIWQGLEGTYATAVTYAIQSDGSLWVYGKNTAFSSGFGYTGSTTSTGDAWVRIGTSNDWKQVSVGWGWAAAVKEDGSLWTWGDNTEGQLGLGDTIGRTVPTRVGTENYWKEVRCGGSQGGTQTLFALTYY